MKICVFSDIHGNYEALNKMLQAECENVEMFIFAGDIFGYFYNQSEIIQKLMKIHNLLAVKGNHDHYYLTQMDKTNLKDRYGSSYDSFLTTEQMDFIALLPDHIKTTIQGKKVGIFHGGPDNYMEQRIYPDSEMDFGLLQREYDFVIFGHTHYGFVRKVGNTLILNPGSLGQPRDGKGFCYCILDLEDFSYCFKKVKVDVDELLSQVKEKDGDKSVCTYLMNKYRS